MGWLKGVRRDEGRWIKCGAEGGEKEVGEVMCLEEERREEKGGSKQQTALVSRRLCLWISDADAWRCHRRDLHQ